MKRAGYININVGAISAVCHQCSGCDSAADCCCAKYEVCAGTREMRAIVGMLPLAAKYCPWLKGKHGFENVFDEVERGLYAIDTHENGLCVFAYHCDSGVRCSLHSAAMQLVKPFHLLKPFACTLWPLVFREPPNAALSICDDALKFSCNKSRKGKRGAISSEMLDSIRSLLGEEACADVVKAAGKGVRRIKVPLCGPLAGDVSCA
jgi:hypothetical protein